MRRHVACRGREHRAEHGDLPLCIDNTHIQRVTLSVMPTMTFLVSGGLPRNSERWYRCWDESYPNGRSVITATHTFIVVGALSRSGLAQTRSELLPTSSRAPDLSPHLPYHDCHTSSSLQLTDEYKYTPTPTVQATFLPSSTLFHTLPPFCAIPVPADTS